MKQQTKLELVVGVFVLAGLAGVSYLALKVGANSLVGGDTYVVSGECANIGNLAPGSNVVISGVPVGRVEAVRLNPKNFRAIVDLRLEKAVQLPSDSVASVKSSGLIGDKYLEISPGAESDFVAPGGKLIEPINPDVDIVSLLSRFAFGSVQTEKTDKK
jgi:phospholipid/cholesterol/gamma-HCH transport system substrate-binding protein